MKFVGTKEQSADILTKGSFTADAWKCLLELCLIGPYKPQKQIKLTAISNIPEQFGCSNPFSAPRLNLSINTCLTAAMVRTNTSAAEVPFAGNVSRPGGQGQKPSPPMPFGLSTQVAIPRADTQKENTETYGPPTNVIHVNGFMPRIGYPTGEEI